MQRLRDADPGRLTPENLEEILEDSGAPNPSLTTLQLAALLGGTSIDDIEDFLPETLTTALAGIAFDGLAAEVINLSPSRLPPPPDEQPPFGIEASRIPYFSIAVSAVNGWEVLPNAVTIKPGLGLTLTLVNGNIESGQTIGMLTGTFALGAVDIPAFLQATLGGYWVIGLQPEHEVVLPSLSDLLALAGGGQSFLDSLPPGFAAIPTIVIEKLAISFNPAPPTPKIARIDFALYTGSIWEVIPDYFTVTSVSCRNGHQGRNQRCTHGHDQPARRLRDRRNRRCSAASRPRKEAPTGRSHAAFRPTGTINLTDTAAALLPGKTIPSDAPELVFTTLQMTVTQATGFLRFQAGSNTPWVITQQLAIRSFHLDFIYDQGRIAGTIEGTLLIADVDLTLKGRPGQHPGRRLAIHRQDRGRPDHPNRGRLWRNSPGTSASPARSPGQSRHSCSRTSRSLSRPGPWTFSSVARRPWTSETARSK